MEDRRQAIILILVMVFFLIGIVVAYMLSDPAAKKAGGGLRADQRFKAKPGTTRENAVALTSSKRPGGVDDLSGDSSETVSKDPVDVRSLSPVEPQESTPAEIHEQQRLLDTALTVQIPEEGIKTLIAALETAQSAEAQSRLNEALAELYLRCAHPDPETSAAHFEKAFQQAATIDARNEIALRAADALQGKNRADLALQQLQRAVEAVPESAPAGAAELKLLVLCGDLLAASGNVPAAEQSYAKVVERGARGPATLDAAAIESLRLAGIRLSQLYRSQQRHEDADAVAKRVQSRLRMTETVIP